MPLATAEYKKKRRLRALVLLCTHTQHVLLDLDSSLRVAFWADCRCRECNGLLKNRATRSKIFFEFDFHFLLHSEFEICIEKKRNTTTRTITIKITTSKAKTLINMDIFKCKNGMKWSQMCAYLSLQRLCWMRTLFI